MCGAPFIIERVNMPTSLSKLPSALRTALRKMLRSDYFHGWKEGGLTFEHEVFLEIRPDLEIEVVTGGNHVLAYRHYCLKCKLFGPVVACGDIDNPTLRYTRYKDIAWSDQHQHRHPARK